MEKGLAASPPFPQPLLAVARSKVHITKGFIGTPVAFALTSTVSAAGPTATETMRCKLTNVSEDKALYNGECTVTQEVSGKLNAYTVTMGSADPFRFTTSDGETWMYGSEEVQFRDLDQGAIFKWSELALAVAE
jgi:hypothetical protein